LAGAIRRTAFTRAPQNGRAGPSDAANKTAPTRKIRAEPPRAQIAQTALTQALLVPPSFSASSREPSASVAQRRDGIGGAERHGEGCGDAGPEETPGSMRTRARGSHRCMAEDSRGTGF